MVNYKLNKNGVHSFLWISATACYSFFIVYQPDQLTIGQYNYLQTISKANYDQINTEKSLNIHTFKHILMLLFSISTVPADI